MCTSLKSFFVMLAVAALLTAPLAAQPLPRLAISFCGTYQWDGETVKATVQLDLVSRMPQGDGTWLLAGSGWTTINRPNETVALQIEGVFDPRDRRIELTESVAPEIMNWDSDGSYVGTVNERGDAFVAIWTSRKPPHAKGRLVLGPCQAPST